MENTLAATPPLSTVNGEDLDGTIGAGTYFGTLSIGQQEVSSVETAYDRDIFEMYLSQAGVYTLDMNSYGVDSLVDTYIYGVYDSYGNYVNNSTNDDFYGLESHIEFEIGTAGTYYVQVGGYGSNTGVYSLDLSLERVVSNTDDYSSSANGAGTLAIGGIETGTIERDGDTDWFEVQLVAGHTYQIDLQGNNGSNDLSDPYLRGIYRSDGTMISGTQNDDYSGLDSQVTFTATSSGTYYVSAGAFGSNTGDYLVSIADLTPETSDDTSISVTPLNGAPQYATGEISFAYEVDTFAMDLIAGQTYTLDMLGETSELGTLFDTYIDGVYDQNGNFVYGTTDDDSGQSLESFIEFQAAQTGTYTVDVRAFGGGTGTYSLLLRDTGSSDDYGQGTATTGILNVNGSVFGTIEEGDDTDWFQLSLETGRQYTITLRGDDTENELGDPLIEGVYNQTGDMIPGTRNDDFDGLNSQITFSVSESGTYYLSAASFGSNTGSYVATLSEEAVQDDYASDTSTTARLDVGGFVDGTIETPDDVDWVRINMEAGSTYELYVDPYASYQQEALYDIEVANIYDQYGSLLETLNVDSGYHGFAWVELAGYSTGTYYVSIEGQYGSTGGYTVSMYEYEDLPTGPTDDFTQDTTTSGSLAPDSIITGSIDFDGDEDWIAIQFTEGGEYLISLEGLETAGGSLNDPYFRGIYDTFGNLVYGTTNDDGGQGLNSEVIFTAYETGTYYLSAGAFADGTGTYSLSVTTLSEPVTSSDDFASNTSTSGSVSPGSYATGHIEIDGDQDWFAVDLQAGLYTINLEGAASGSGTLNDPYLRGVYDASGALIEGTTNDDANGLESEIELSIGVAGRYYISAGAFGSDTGTYKVSVSENQSDTSGDTISQDTSTTAELVLVDGTATLRSEINFASDQDWIEMAVVAGQTYQIDLEGAPTSSGTLSDPYIRGIYDANGALISDTFDDDSGTGLNSSLEFTASQSGRIFISAGAYGDATGSYTITVTQDQAATGGGTQPPETDTDDQQDMNVWSSVDGRIDYEGDQDQISITLSAGKTYQIDLRGVQSNEGTLSDPYIRGVIGPDGQVIEYSQDDDGGDGLESRLLLPVSQDGDYTIIAGAYSGTGSYNLSVVEYTASGGSGGSGGGNDGGGSAAPSNGDFDIVIEYNGDDAYREYFERAEATWESIITGDIADINGVDDLVIEASVQNIDGRGGILGQAGGTDFRWSGPDAYLAYRGVMQFDSADLAGMVANGTIQDVIEHEMGHVLGINGWTWQYLGLTNGNLFIGENAVNVLESWTGQQEAGVLLESRGGQGTAGSHWDEDTFTVELMTGYAENGAMPLTALTIAALADMGYDVDMSRAELHPEFASNIGSLLGSSAERVELAASVEDIPQADQFDGVVHVNYDDRAIIVTADADAEKLEGTIISADETTVWAFVDGTNGDVRMELTGLFEKDNPVVTEDIKGTVTSITFYEGNDITAEYRIPASQEQDVQALLNDWRGFSLDQDNYFASNSATAQQDVVFAGGGNDIVRTGAGNDQLMGGTGNDQLVAGTGDDVIVDTWGNDTVFGEADNDNITMFSGENLISGDAGHDTLRGGVGDDTLMGGDDNDVLIGDLTGQSSTSDDRLVAGSGTDLLEGGYGEDVFVFGTNEGSNTIAELILEQGTYQAQGQDFNVAQDTLELQGFGLSYSSAMNHFTQVGENAVFDYQGTEIVLVGVELSALSADNFDFV